MVRITELHKLRKTNREIGRITGVPEKKVSVFLKKWRANGCKGVPYHKHGGGPAKKIVKKL